MAEALMNTHCVEQYNGGDSSQCQEAPIPSNISLFSEEGDTSLKEKDCAAIIAFVSVLETIRRSGNSPSSDYDEIFLHDADHRFLTP